MEEIKMEKKKKKKNEFAGFLGRVNNKRESRSVNGFEK